MATKVTRFESIIQCPYCGYTFPRGYYYATHVPCPSPRGDKKG